MSLRTLSYFLTVVEEMNFHRAAEKLYITQQSLSSHIKKLETEYNVVLFERRPRLMLTPAGESMAEYARRMLHTEAQLTANLADITRTSTGILHIGITGTRGMVFLPRIWNIYHRQFPNIIVSVSEDATRRLDELLLSGKISLHIGVNIPTHNNTELLTLSQDKVYCIFSRSFFRHSPEHWRDILCRPDGVDLTQVMDIPMITFSHDNGLRRMLDEFFEQRGLRPRIIFETSRHDLVLNLCRQGSGIGVVYNMILYDALQNQDIARELYAFPIKNSLTEKFTQIAYRKESFRPEYLKGFIRAAQDVFKKYTASIDGIIQNAATIRDSENETYYRAAADRHVK